MNTYHICYTIGKELCTGTNILAKTYGEAETKFRKKHLEMQIVYISILAQ